LSLLHKPHTVTVSQVQPNVTSREITGYDRSTEVEVSGQITEKMPDVVFKDYGIDVKFPAYFLCDFEDASSVKVGDWLTTADSRIYNVLSGPKLMDADPVTSHALYLCRRTI